MSHRPIGRVENYTTPFLASFGLLLFIGLTACRVVYGWPSVLILSLGLNLWFNRYLP